MSIYNLPAFEKKVMWQEMLRHELLATLDHQPVVIVPVGSIEQHGPHCPMDVDMSTPFHLAVAAAQAIDDFPVIVAPPQTYGFTHYNMGEIGTITISLETFIATLNDIARSIWANGFRRIIMLNGHGGNEQPNWAAAVKIAEEDVWVLALTYWHMADPELTRLERSRRRQHRPRRRMGNQPPALSPRTPRRHESRRPRSRCAPNGARNDNDSHHFRNVAGKQENGVMGNPLVASREKGERLFNVLLERLIETCREYHEMEPPQYREFGSHSL